MESLKTWATVDPGAPPRGFESRLSTRTLAGSSSSCQVAPSLTAPAPVRSTVHSAAGSVSLKPSTAPTSDAIPGSLAMRAASPWKIADALHAPVPV